MSTPDTPQQRWEQIEAAAKSDDARQTLVEAVDRWLADAWDEGHADAVRMLASLRKENPYRDGV